MLFALVVLMGAWGCLWIGVSWGARDTKVDRAEVPGQVKIHKQTPKKALQMIMEATAKKESKEASDVAPRQNRIKASAVSPDAIIMPLVLPPFFEDRTRARSAPPILPFEGSHIDGPAVLLAAAAFVNNSSASMQDPPGKDGVAQLPPSTATADDQAQLVVQGTSAMQAGAKKCGKDTWKGGCCPQLTANTCECNWEGYTLELSKYVSKGDSANAQRKGSVGTCKVTCICKDDTSALTSNVQPAKCSLQVGQCSPDSCGPQDLEWQGPEGFPTFILTLPETLKHDNVYKIAFSDAKVKPNDGGDGADGPSGDTGPYGGFCDVKCQCHFDMIFGSRCELSAVENHCEPEQP